MKERCISLNLLLLSVFILSMFIVPIGEGLLIGLMLWFGNKHSVFLISVLLIIILNLVLLKVKKDYHVLYIIIVFCQIILLILLLVDYFYVTAFMVFATIMITISLLQIINLFFKSAKGYKYGSIIIRCLSLLCLITFWYLNTNLSRFEFALNDDGESYSIMEIKSDIHTIKIPNIYKGLPVTGLYDVHNLDYKRKIKKIIFKDDSNIEVIDYLSFSLSRLKSIKLPRSLKRIGDGTFDSDYLEEIIIPIEVVYIEKSAFNYCKNTIIYCEAESRPDTWDEHWYNEVKEIIWGW